MRNSIKALAVTSAVIASLAAAPALYAEGSKESGSSGRMMGQGGMMNQGGMMGMMGQMSEMMENCNKMMQSMNRDGSGQPNEQGREDAPGTNG
ncbi:hypothetical protein ACFOW6_04900 [Fodinicurvata halophila]|uniref:Uncharacterized protein n=1 Tax=Fodinicurvata halophila TaxID=1419723 RepID=A0ABV8UK74_9PROT